VTAARTVIAYVGDLMDRSRISAAVPDCRFASVPDESLDADVFIVDLTRFSDVVAGLRATCPASRVIAYGPHVDDALAAAAAAEGADAVMARSRFFRDINAAIATSTGR
jgi:hypothetical protein